MRLSLIIPAFNSGKKLPLLFDAVRRQTLRPDEIVVIDSFSSDDTAAVAAAEGARVITVHNEDFDHGGTRTIGAKASGGDILLFMTDDALPAGDDAFSEIVRPFIDEKIGAVCGRQLPHAGATAVAGHLRAFNYPDVSRTLSYEDRAKYGIKTAFLSDSFCAYRRAALEDAGWFRERLIISEDMCAGYDMLRKGWKLHYCAKACAYHSHNYSPGQEFSRYFDIGVMHSLEHDMIADLGRAESEGVRYILSALASFGWEVWLYPGFFLRVAAKLAGYRLGLAHRMFSGALCRSFSMHKSWWDKNKA
jgi:rhamnosyltransferase